MGTEIKLSEQKLFEKQECVCFVRDVCLSKMLNENRLKDTRLRGQSIQLLEFAHAPKS